LTPLIHPTTPDPIRGIPIQVVIQYKPTQPLRRAVADIPPGKWSIALKRREAFSSPSFIPHLSRKKEKKKKRRKKAG